jgi:hypothetical protein
LLGALASWRLISFSYFFAALRLCVECSLWRLTAGGWQLRGAPCMPPFARFLRGLGFGSALTIDPFAVRLICSLAWLAVQCSSVEKSEVESRQASRNSHHLGRIIWDASPGTRYLGRFSGLGHPSSFIPQPSMLPAW